jgi:hypothetical protein
MRVKCTFPPGVGHEKNIIMNPIFVVYTLKGSTFKITDDKRDSLLRYQLERISIRIMLYIHEVVNVGDGGCVLIIEAKKWVFFTLSILISFNITF